MEVPEAVGAVPKDVLFAVLPFLAITIGLSLVRIYTTLNYYRTVKDFQKNPSSSGKRILQPPQIPYTLPFLGNTVAFLNKQPGQFWQNLFSWHPRSTGVCTILLGGKRTHILFSPPGVQAMFKDRTMKRDVFDHELYTKVFAMPDGQVKNVEESKHLEHEMNSQYLIKHDRVNELTAKFTEVLDRVLSKDSQDLVDKDSVLLYRWIRDRMFTSSTTALMGETLLEMYPEYCADFFKFDNDFLGYFFGLPGFMMRDANATRAKMLTNLENWSKVMHERGGGEPVDPDTGPAWEPLFGSRLNRARQITYRKRKMNARSSAALDIGITFGLSSNAIPATGWMLMNVLNPDGDQTLLPRVMKELRRVENADGSVDIPTLIASPLVQCVWTETLRLATDVLVSRNLTEDATLPLDEDGKILVSMKKGDNIIAPCWLGHHDEKAWSGREAPTEQFWADRFLAPDPADPTKQIFTLSGTNGKFFPFGGGKTICPGRVFAKQEAIGAFAIILLRFEFEVLGFVDKDGKDTEQFVGLANAFPGSGALVPGGDLKVRVRKRQRLN